MSGNSTPLGLVLAGIGKDGSHRYLYNSDSEQQADLTGKGYLYETPLRNYDPQLGRFQGVDILAGTSTELSPYHYAGNNPILYADPSGATRIKMQTPSDSKGGNPLEPPAGSLAGGGYGGFRGSYNGGNPVWAASSGYSGLGSGYAGLSASAFELAMGFYNRSPNNASTTYTNQGNGSFFYILITA
jgi:RHS repeat-associated protein